MRILISTLLIISLVFCNVLTISAREVFDYPGLTIEFKQIDDSTLSDGQAKVAAYIHGKASDIDMVTGAQLHYNFNNFVAQLKSIEIPDFASVTIIVNNQTIEHNNANGTGFVSYISAERNPALDTDPDADPILPIDFPLPAGITDDTEVDCLFFTLLFEGENGVEFEINPEVNNLGIANTVLTNDIHYILRQNELKGTKVTFKGNKPSHNWSTSSPGGGGGGGFYVPPAPSPSADPTPTPIVFADLEGYEWAEYDIYTLANAGIIKGVGDNLFAPGLNIKRGDIILMLQRALKLEAEIVENFSDVPENSYYYEAIGMLRTLGIAQGYNEYEFKPEQIVSRQELVTLLYRAYYDQDIFPTEINPDALGVFSDKDDIDEYAFGAVCGAVQKGIMLGKGGIIDPHAPATRAETAAILNRIMYIILVREHPVEPTEEIITEETETADESDEETINEETDEEE